MHVAVFCFFDLHLQGFLHIVLDEVFVPASPTNSRFDIFWKQVVILQWFEFPKHLEVKHFESTKKFFNLRLTIMTFMKLEPIVAHTIFKKTFRRLYVF